MGGVISTAMNVLLLGLSVEPVCLQRVISDVARDTGYEELTPDQVVAITMFAQGKDVCLLVSRGKSVCFALLRTESIRTSVQVLEA